MTFRGLETLLRSLRQVPENFHNRSQTSLKPSRNTLETHLNLFEKPPWNPSEIPSPEIPSSWNFWKFPWTHMKSAQSSGVKVRSREFHHKTLLQVGLRGFQRGSTVFLGSFRGFWRVYVTFPEVSESLKLSPTSPWNLPQPLSNVLEAPLVETLKLSWLWNLPVIPSNAPETPENWHKLISTRSSRSRLGQENFTIEPSCRDVSEGFRGVQESFGEVPESIQNVLGKF